MCRVSCKLVKHFCHQGAPTKTISLKDYHTSNIMFSTSLFLGHNDVSIASRCESSLGVLVSCLWDMTVFYGMDVRLLVFFETKTRATATAAVVVSVSVKLHYCILMFFIISFYITCLQNCFYCV